MIEIKEGTKELADDSDNNIDDTEQIAMTYSNTKSKQFAKLLIFRFLSSFLLSLMIILPLYLSQYFGGCLDENNVNYVDSDCLPDLTEYARYIAITVPINIAVQFLFSAFIGRLTDSFGRKLFLIIPTFLTVIQQLLMCFYFNIWIYTILSILSGFISLDSVKTMISDTINPQQRTNAFAAFSVAGAIGSFIGVIVGSIISTIHGTHTIFYISSAGYILLLIHILFVMNETIDINKNRRLWNKNEIRNPLRPLFIARKNKLILWICVSTVPLAMAIGIFGSFASYLGAEIKLKDDSEMTFILAVLGVIIAISTILSNAILLPLLQSKLKMNDINIMIFSLIMLIITLICFGIIPFSSSNLDIPVACIGAVFGGIASIFGAVQNGMISKVVHKEYQGVAFGVLTAYYQIALIFAFPISGFLYIELDKNNMRYIIFIFAIFFVMISMVLTIFPLKKQLNKHYSSNEKIKLLSRKNIFEKVEQKEDIETTDLQPIITNNSMQVLENQTDGN